MTAVERVPWGVYAIVDGDTLAPSRFVDAALALVDGGVRWLQVRHKSASSRQLYDSALAIREGVAGLGVTLIVNDRADVAVAVGAQGVHVGQDDLPAAMARAIVGPEAVVGLSTHDVAEALAAARELVDYVGVGPVFASRTKSGHAPVLGPGGLAAVVAASAHPVVAIGGVTVERLGEVRRAGAQAAALIADLLGAPDLRARAAEAVQAWREAGR